LVVARGFFQISQANKADASEGSGMVS